MIRDLEQAFQTYKLYVALKNHFTSPYYDFFKYNGVVKAGRSTFDRRSDKYFFAKLAKKQDLQNYLVANFVDNHQSWVGELVNTTTSDKVYTKWLGRQQSMSYLFESDLSKLSDNFNENILVVDKQHPRLLKLVLRKEISIETLIILNSLCKFFKHWSRSIEEQFIWPQLKFKCKKYKPFIQYDLQKYKKIVVDKFQG